MAQRTLVRRLSKARSTWRSRSCAAGRRDSESGSAPEPVRVDSHGGGRAGRLRLRIANDLAFGLEADELRGHQHHDPADRGIDHSRLDHHQLASDDDHRHDSTTASTGRLLGLAGQYEGKAGSSGSLFVRSDGASRFDNVDPTACPSCNSAQAPHATIDFTLTTISPPGDPGSYTASGAITDESDPANARTFAGPVGAAVKLSVSPPGTLTVSFLAPPDHLCKVFGASTAPGCF